MDSHHLPRMSRREIIKWLAATTAAMAASGTLPLGNLAYAAPIDAPGYGSDPDVLKFYKPGDVWPLTLNEAQRNTTTVLCDIILPADHLGPAASTLGVPQFVDEWVSAPYPIQALDRPIILEGLAWLDTEAKKRFQNNFAALDATQHKAICDDICNAATAKPEFEAPSHFFARFRAIAAGGYFSTPEGWTAIGYVGNAPLASFDGPPKAVLDRLGVEQTVQ